VRSPRLENGVVPERRALAVCRTRTGTSGSTSRRGVPRWETGLEVGDGIQNEEIFGSAAVLHQGSPTACWSLRPPRPWPKRPWQPLATVDQLSRDGPPRLMVHAHDQQFVGMPLVIDSERRDAPTPHDSTRAKSRDWPLKTPDLPSVRCTARCQRQGLRRRSDSVR
jgi:hypothetical protein